MSGACSVMKSACGHSSSRLTGSHLQLPAPFGDTNGSCTITFIPRPRARDETSWPIRPKPTMPSVLSANSTPPNRERSHRPAVSAAWAWGMFRATASSRPSGVLGRRHHVRAWRVGNDDAATSGGIDVHVVHAGAGPADHLQPASLLDQLRSHLGGAAHDQPRRSRRSAANSSSAAHSIPMSTSKCACKQLDSSLGDRLLHQHPVRRLSHRRRPPARPSCPRRARAVCIRARVSVSSSPASAVMMSNSFM